MTETLEQGPLYFFDQPKIKKEWDKIMGLGEQLADLNSSSSNSHKTGCIHRNSGCTEEYMEGNGTLMKSNTAKKDPDSPQMYDPSVFRTICEDPLAQLSQKPLDPLTEDVLLLTLSEEFKGMALTLLCELEEILNHFSKYKFVLPQGILNVLPCSWEELSEDALYIKKKSRQEPAYKSIRSRRWQTSEECNRLSPTSEYVDCEMAEGIKRQHRRNVAFPTGVTKATKNPETLLNRLSGNKVSEQYTSDSLVAISFSLSSKLPEERGWDFHHSDSDCKGLEWKAPHFQALERLRLAKIQITEQLSKFKESRIDKPVILRHYADIRKESFLKNIKEWTCKRFSSKVLNEKLKLPVMKQPEPALKKLHYELADGSSFIYYPSGNSAVCQSYSNLPAGGMYTNIFNDVPDRALLGTFTPFGHGSVCFPNSNNIAMIFNQEGGMVTNEGGEILHEWKWPGVGKLDNPVIVQVNKCITVKIAGRFAIFLVYKWQHESVRLSLSPVRSVTVPQVTKTPSVPEEDLSHIKDFSAARELRKLRRKIKTILENWLEYYWIAFGLSSPHIHNTFPLQTGRLRKAQLPVVSPALQKAQQKKKCNDNKAPALVQLSRFQSAPARSPRQDVSHGSSRAPHILNSIYKTNQPFVTHINKDKPIFQISSKASEKPWYPSCTSCPAALRRAMLGGEGKLCNCSNHQIPDVTDLEYNHIINNPVSSPEQITVVCITSSLRATDYDPSPDKHLESLYERKNKNRSMPCIQSRLDSFRLLKYDINSADEFTDHCGSLLVKRHNVAPGMFLMYIQGKLLFANYIFNGYSKSAEDLQKQITLTRCDYNRGYYLPTDYRFSSHKNSLQSFPEHVEARIPNDVSGWICYATQREK